MSSGASPDQFGWRARPMGPEAVRYLHRVLKVSGLLGASTFVGMLATELSSGQIIIATSKDAEPGDDPLFTTIGTIGAAAGDSRSTADTGLVARAGDRIDVFSDIPSPDRLRAFLAEAGQQEPRYTQAIGYVALSPGEPAFEGGVLDLEHDVRTYITLNGAPGVPIAA